VHVGADVSVMAAYSDLVCVCMVHCAKKYFFAQWTIQGLFKKYPTFGREKYIYTPGSLQP